MNGDLSDCRLMEEEPRKVPFFVSFVICAVAGCVFWGGLFWFAWTMYKAVTR